MLFRSSSLCSEVSSGTSFSTSADGAKHEQLKQGMNCTNSTATAQVHRKSWFTNNLGISAKAPNESAMSYSKYFAGLIRSRMSVDISAPVIKERTHIKRMLSEYGHEQAKALIDLIVYDWAAIKATKGVARTAPVPSFYLLYTLRRELSAAVQKGTGVTNEIHRTSEWANEFRD